MNDRGIGKYIWGKGRGAHSRTIEESYSICNSRGGEFIRPVPPSSYIPMAGVNHGRTFQHN